MAEIVKEERNERGQVTYWEDRVGFWEKREYDANGNRTYYESSNGYWEKSEYDANGNKSYYENCNIGILYDKREQTKAEPDEIDK